MERRSHFYLRIITFLLHSSLFLPPGTHSSPSLQFITSSDTRLSMRGGDFALDACVCPQEAAGITLNL